ncbi:MAG: rRNA maturation RNase YbeY [Alphaproteobacteria bacterium]
MLKPLIQIDAKLPLPKAEFTRAIKAACKAVAPHVSAQKDVMEVTIRLAENEEVQALNKQFRGKDYATNVLSFPSEDEGYAGDIIIAVPVLVKEAETEGKPVLHHLQHLVIHGILHVHGFDHENEADAAEMEGLETILLATLNIPNPYA